MSIIPNGERDAGIKYQKRNSTIREQFSAVITDELANGRNGVEWFYAFHGLPYICNNGL
jgi:hypothetical protein